MAVDTAITNGQVVSPTGTVRSGVAIKDGKIVAIAPEPYLPTADRTIDAKDKFVIPGFIDNHCHIDVQLITGQDTYEGCFEKETKAAIAGGVTTIGPMPIVPSIVDYFEEWRKTFDSSALCDAVFHFYASSERHLDDLPKCPELGIVTIGEMGGYRGHQAEAIQVRGEPALVYIDDGRLYAFMEIIGRWGSPGRLMLHAENIDIILPLIGRVAAEGRRDSAAWTAARPAFCEAEKLQCYVELAKAAKCPIYIVHNTCREALDVVRRAKSEGVDIVAETCPQYLSLTKDSFQNYPPMANVNPPLREAEDNEALWQGINDGTVETVATDHAPWTRAQKGDNIMQAPMGLGNVLSTWMPAMITYGVKSGRITLEKMVEICCSNPAKYMGLLPKKGIISVGSDADIAIIDMKRKMVPKATELFSATELNAYEVLGVELEGWPILTMVRGNVVMEDGKIVGQKGIGNYIPIKLDGK
jgi:dihydroorotase (multifunctional complex type)